MSLTEERLREVVLAAARRVDECARRLHYLVAEGSDPQAIAAEAETLRAWLIDVEVGSIPDGGQE